MENQQLIDIVKSPCVGVCCLDDKDLCIACKRSGMEIAQWGIYTPSEKREVLQAVEQRYKEENK
jgi:predicted Fe-S protein YdhL (DUF1289 family)